jgi:hypothetical protein
MRKTLDEYPETLTLEETAEHLRVSRIGEAGPALTGPLANG